jgi:predicted MFS family arabinose efflux permease
MKTPVKGKSDPLLTRPFLLLSAAHLFFGLAFWPYVLLPVFLQDLGADLLIVGLIMGAAPLSGIAARPWVGSALDRVGRKKILLTGGAIFLAANLLYLQVDHLGVLVYAVRLLHGLGMGILMATFFTLAADLSPDARITEGIALFGISGHISGAIGVMMGEEVLRLAGYHALFWTCSGLSLVSILLSTRIPEPGHHQPEAPQKGFMRLALSPSLRVPLAVTVGFAVSIASYLVFLKPYARSVGVDSVATFFLPYTLTAIAVRLIGGNWPDRYGLRRIAIPATVCSAMGIVILMVFPTPAGLAAAGVFCGMGHGFLFPILSVMVIGTARTADRGTRMTLYTMLFDVGLFIGPPILGWIGRGGNFVGIFMVAGAVQIANLIAFAVTGKNRE